MMIRSRPAGTGDLSKKEAQDLTERIRRSVDSLWSLLTEAHDRKAWQALGHTSWKAYVEAEFGMSRGYSYRLLQQGAVINAIKTAVGEVSPIGDISEGVARELGSDLPAAIDAIRDRVEAGEKPADVAKDVAAQRRQEREQTKAAREAQQAEFDRQAQENASKLPDDIKQQQAFKDAAKAASKQKRHEEGLTLEERVAELEDNIAVLEKDNAALKAENKKFGEMKVLWEKGGVDAIVAAKDDVIHALQTRLYSESREKISNLRRGDFFLKILNEKYDHFKDVAIDPETGEAEYV